MASIVAMDDPSVIRFWAKVNFGGQNGCWDWASSMYQSGYGRFMHGGKQFRAHRVAYEMNVGPAPIGFDVDHLCRNRRCVNPAHLELVTHQENVLRGSGPTAVNAAKTHCIHGHEFTPENTKVGPRGNRQCRACWRRPRPSQR